MLPQFKQKMKDLNQDLPLCRQGQLIKKLATLINVGFLCEVGLSSKTSLSLFLVVGLIFFT